MLTAFGSDYRHSTPPREGMKYGFRERDIVAWRFTKRQSGYQGDYWVLSISGNCCTCPVYFSETKKTLMEGLKTPVSAIWQVIKARTEGMGLNAAARTFNKAKNTILAWESKFAELHQVLFLYALVHEFFVSVIEGDEAYTKVRKNVPPDQSPGWTILLMDRASRFIWELECGKKDRKLFQKA